MLAEDGAEVNDSLNLANIFNDYFSNIARDLDRNIPRGSINPLTYVTIRSLSSFF